MAPTAFVLNPNARITVRHLGVEARPLVIVDDLLLEPRVLLDLAGDGTAFAPDPGNFYPGVRMALPDAYGAALARLADEQLRGPFGIADGRVCVPLMPALSMATRRPESLAPIQCIPHFDTAEDQQLAAVHYLCGPEHGGTSFYRHRATGFEAVSVERAVRYQKTLARQATTDGLPARTYINGDTALFTRIGAVEAQFNRAIFYHSNSLHAGSIDASQGLSADPRKGRLTATCLIRLDLA